MLKNLKINFKKNSEVFSLIILILFASILTTYLNLKKNYDEEKYNNFIDNVYLKKTLNHLVNNLEPKVKKIKNKINSGETFDKILESYSIEKKEIQKIKNSLQKKINLNKLNTRQIIHFNLDKTNKNHRVTYQISSTQKFL